jgi:hypothetical protein
MEILQAAASASQARNSAQLTEENPDSAARGDHKGLAYTSVRMNLQLD